MSKCNSTRQNSRNPEGKIRHEDGFDPHTQNLDFFSDMKRSGAAIICFAVLGLHSAILAQAAHFAFRANTEDNYAIVVQSATVNEVPLENGDEIGVFTPTGLCVGAVVVDRASNIAFSAWEDDSFTTEIDGYHVGEQMEFRAWDASSQTELAMAASYVQGDGKFGSGPLAKVNLSLQANLPPRLSFQERYEFDEDTVLELILNDYVADDNDNPAFMTWSVTPGNNITSSIQIGDVTHRVLFEPAPNWFGAEAFTLIVQDPAGASDTAEVTLVVRSVNDLPVLQLPNLITIIEDSSVTLTLDSYVTDVESTPAQMTWQVTPDPNIAATLNSTNRTVLLKPRANFNGAGQIGLNVKDSDQGSSSGTVSISVTPVPDRPLAAILLSPVRGVQVDTINVSLRWRASLDPDGDRVTYFAVYGTTRSLTTQFVRSGVLTDTSYAIAQGFLKPGNWYYWRVESNDGTTPTTISRVDSFRTAPRTSVDETAAVPEAFSLAQNYPNPFSLNAAKTSIRFGLPAPTVVSIALYNAIGQKIRTVLQQQMPAGFHQVEWDGVDEWGNKVRTGLYWLRMEAEQFTSTRKVLVLQ